MATKKQKPLTPAMQDCLQRFGGDEYKMPFGRDIRTCEALNVRGLLESEHMVRSRVQMPDGRFATTFSLAYRAIPEAARSALAKAVDGRAKAQP